MKPVDVDTALYRAQVIRRSVIQGASDLPADDGDEREALQCALRAMERATLTSHAMGSGLQALRGLVEKDLGSFFLRMERRFDGYHDEFDGAVGTVVDVAVYAAGAERLLALQAHLAELTPLRQAVLDRLAASREAEAILAGPEEK